MPRGGLRDGRRDSRLRSSNHGDLGPLERREWELLRLKGAWCDGLRDLNLAVEDEFAHVDADVDAEAAGRDGPLLCVDVVVGKGVAVESDRNVFRLLRGE
jgi:hypothetical protein